jgi:Uma2 family endonuclease
VTTLTAPAPMLWTLDDYHRLIDTGLLAGRRVQLLEGELIEMPPMNTPHIGAMNYLYRTLVAALGERVSSQTPIMIDPTYGPPSEPEPDVFVRRPGAPLKPWIEAVDLIVEVSDSTVARDRARKVAVYLAAGAREVWLVDLAEQSLTAWRAGARSVARPPARLEPLLTPPVVIDLAAVFDAARQP